MNWYCAQTRLKSNPKMVMRNREIIMVTGRAGKILQRRRSEPIQYLEKGKIVIQGNRETWGAFCNRGWGGGAEGNLREAVSAYCLLPFGMGESNCSPHWRGPKDSQIGTAPTAEHGVCCVQDGTCTCIYCSHLKRDKEDVQPRIEIRPSPPKVTCKGKGGGCLWKAQVRLDSSSWWSLPLTR